MASFPNVRHFECPADAGSLDVLRRPRALAGTAAPALSELATLRGHNAVLAVPATSTSTLSTLLVGAPASFSRSRA